MNEEELRLIFWSSRVRRVREELSNAIVERDKSILLFLDGGFTEREIARLTDLSRSKVHAIRNSRKEKNELLCGENPSH